MPYVETVHADGTPYMEPLTVYAPPGGTVVSSVMPGTAARPPIPTRFASLPEADESPLDNTVYQCQPSGYMVGPVGYHCTPACTDSAMWRSDFGDCSVYRATFTPGGFKDYCGTDKDIAGDNRSLCFRASTCATESAGERAKRALCTCMMCALAYRVDREYAHLVCAPTYTHTRAHARTHTHTHTCVCNCISIRTCTCVSSMHAIRPHSTSLVSGRVCCEGCGALPKKNVFGYARARACARGFLEPMDMRVCTRLLPRIGD